MPDAKIVKSWKITETLLERARRALSARDERQYAALLSRYREFMEHNELGLALDILEELGHLVSARGGFWRDLERAAENMGLAERLPAFRKAFSEAPGSAPVDGSPADPMRGTCIHCGHPVGYHHLAGDKCSCKDCGCPGYEGATAT
jgi:hypothetical protein